VPVALSGATDPDGDAVTIRITGASGGAAGDVLLGPGPGEASLRAEKLLRGATRVYQLSFTADDGRGGTCTGTVSAPVSP
jgi:hypothetical protein